MKVTGDFKINLGVALIIQQFVDMVLLKIFQSKWYNTLSTQAIIPACCYTDMHSATNAPVGSRRSTPNTLSVKLPEASYHYHHAAPGRLAWQDRRECLFSLHVARGIRYKRVI